MNEPTPDSVVSRAIGAAMLDIETYEAVEADRTATPQAAMVVLAVAISSGIGSWGSGSPGIFAGVISAFLGWLLWAGVTNLVGTKLLGGTADWGELLRTLGFAQAPGVFLILGIIPILGGLVYLVVALWTLATGIVAIRQALDFGTGKAVITALVSLVVVAVAASLLGMIFGVSAGAGGLFAG